MSVFKIVIAGHVDHGKSTLIGKILNESSSILEDRYAKVESICRSKSMKFEYAFLLDAFEEEQKQGITIDKLEIPWRHQEQDYIFIDTPGHKEFINNMVSGSSSAKLALVLIDANEGIQEQTSQHLAVLNLFGVSNLIIVVNKMDLVNYDENIFNSIKSSAELILEKFQFQNVSFIPTAAYFGDNVFENSPNLKWNEGFSLIETIVHFAKTTNLSPSEPNRISVQDVYKFDEKRIYAGIILSGTLLKDTKLNFSMSESSSSIKTFEEWNVDVPRSSYQKGDVVSFTLKDSLFLPIGEVASFDSQAPQKKRSICLSSFWFSKNLPLNNEHYTVKLGNQKLNLKLISFSEVENKIYDLVFTSQSDIIFDFVEDCPNLGRATVLKDFQTVAAGVVQRNKNSGLKVDSISKKPFVIWLTGLSGAGKTTLAKEVKNHVKNIVILDGDELRKGLNSDLTFTSKDREEQTRRTAELAKILTSQGFSVIVSLISPLSSSRLMARKILGKEVHFLETYVKVPFDICAKRDTKGLYRLASDGKVNEFTGVSSNYETPDNPEIILDNHLHSIDENVDFLLKHIEKLKT